MIFVDGQNLMYACQEYANSHGRNYKFYYREEDLERCLINIQPNRKHVQTRFYTAIAEVDPERGEKDVKRYERQLSRCRTLETKLKWFVFRKKTKAYPFYCPYCKWMGEKNQIICQKCGKQIKDMKNKGVDVAIATDLLVYGISDTSSNYDVAILVSGDSDFVPVIKRLKDRRPQVRIEVAQFDRAIGDDLKQAADRFYLLDDFADKIGRLYQKSL